MSYLFLVLALLHWQVSSYLGVPIAPDVVLLGEVMLTGHVGKVKDIEVRGFGP